MGFFSLHVSCAGAMRATAASEWSTEAAIGDIKGTRWDTEVLCMLLKLHVDFHSLYVNYSDAMGVTAASAQDETTSNPKRNQRRQRRRLKTKN